MLTGEIRSQIDQIWNAFWSGGISNPLEVIEQITLAGKTLTANQIQFVNLVIDYLTQSGWMRAAQLYESPFTDFSPRGVEGVFNSTQVTQLLSILESVRQTAAG